MKQEDIDKIRNLLNSRRDLGSTHYEGCEFEHIECAADFLMEELLYLKRERDRLEARYRVSRTEVEQLQHSRDRCSEMVTRCSDQIIDDERYIADLEAERDRLREALREIRDEIGMVDTLGRPPMLDRSVLRSVQKRACAALTPTPAEEIDRG